MKVAVCLSGQPRKFAIGHQYLASSLIDHDVDYFFHLWYDPGEELKMYSTAQQPIVDVAYKDMDQEILELYKPRDYLFEKQIDFPTDEELDLNHGRRTKTRQPSSIFQSMLYSRYKSGQLMSKYINNYDIVVWTRTDVAPTSTFIETIDDDSIYSGYARGDMWLDTCITTGIIASTPQNMKYYLDLYKNYKEIFNEGIDHCDHRLSFAYLKKLNKDFKFILNNNWYWVRAEGLVPGF